LPPPPNAAQYVDFSRAYYVETAAILIRTPEEIQNYLAIFEPFSFASWLCLFVSIVTLILLISVMTKLEDNQRKHEKLHKLVKFLRSASIASSDGGGAAALAAGKLDERRFSARLEHRLAELARAKQVNEYGQSWLERFYYAVTCVMNILLIRGK
jgi:biopolymer transport protein ExbB/TolQ